MSRRVLRRQNPGVWDVNGGEDPLLTPPVAFAQHFPSAAPTAPGPRASAVGQLLLAAAVSVAIGLFLGASGDPIVAGGLVAGGALFALGLARPATLLLLILLVRPLLDELTGFRLGGALNVAGLAGLLIAGLALLMLVSERRTIRTKPMLAFALITLLTAAGAVIAVSSFRGTVGSEPLAETVRLVSVLGVYLLAANVLASERRIRSLTVAISVSAVLPALIGLSELLPGAGATAADGVVRISGPFVGPNPLGLYCAVAALVTIGLPRHWMPRWARVLVLLPVCAALVFTFSREGWAVFVLGLVLLEWRRNPRAVVAGALCIAAVVAFVPAVQDRILPSDDGSGSAQTYESYSWRLANWGDLLGRAADSPFIGYGTRTTEIVNPRRLYGALYDEGGGYQAHHTLVRAAVEGGVVLVLAYLLFALAVVSESWRSARIRWPLQPLGRLVAVLWISFLVVAVTVDDAFDQTAALFALFAITGALEGARRLARTPDPTHA